MVHTCGGILSNAMAQYSIVIFKSEKKLVIVNSNQIVHSFDICSLSGKLGPKEKQGDCQVPEGIYKVNGFGNNSIHINYPNAYDRKNGYTGGGIAIHGKCCSVGCIGFDNFTMATIFKLVKNIYQTQKNIPVIILPARLDTQFFQTNKNSRFYNFWSTLKNECTKFFSQPYLRQQ